LIGNIGGTGGALYADRWPSLLINSIFTGNLAIDVAGSCETEIMVLTDGAIHVDCSSTNFPEQVL
jgi:hypothetical protein